MTAKKIYGLMALLIILLCAVSQLSADVVHESKTQIKLFGTLGTMSKILGLGKPIQTVDYYSGDMMRSDNLDDKGKVKTSEIIDLNKELFITLNHKKQKYTRITFKEWRQQIEEAMAQFEESETEEASEETAPEDEWTIEFDIDRPGGTENINGRDAEKVIMTVIMKRKQQAGEEEQEETASGEMHLTSTSWLCSELEGSDQIDAFNRKLAEKLGFGFDDVQMKSMWEQIMQSYPQIENISKTIEEKGQGLEGTPIRTYAVYETVGQLKAEGEEAEEAPSSVGGLMKGLGKKAVKKDDDGKPKQLIEITSDILRQEITPVDPALFTVPEKYKLDK